MRSAMIVGALTFLVIKVTLTLALLPLRLLHAWRSGYRVTWPEEPRRKGKRVTAEEIQEAFG